MHDCMGLESLKQRTDGCLISNIGADEFIAGIGRDAGERFQIAGIGQFVEVENLVLSGADQVANQG
ncbi:hypothetical protein D3C72_1304970 [compost metagenome]